MANLLKTNKARIKSGINIKANKSHNDMVTAITPAILAYIFLPHNANTNIH